MWFDVIVNTSIGVTAVLTALIVVSRFKPARWLWSTLVSRPLSQWIVNVINGVVKVHLEPIHHELQHNDGSSIKDAVSRIEERLDSQSKDIEHLRKFTDDVAEWQRNRE